MRPVIGAGTVVNTAQFEQVMKEDAEFIVSPGLTDRLGDAIVKSGVPYLPGIANAGDIMRGLDHGHRRFKFFPAESSGGIAALRSFAGPFPQVKFCPTGGIEAASAPRYLALGNVVTVGGSWMVPGVALQGRDWAGIGELARQAAKLR